MRRRIELTPGFAAFLVLLWYFDDGGIFWRFLTAIAVHELAHTIVLLLLGGEIRGLRLGFAQLTLRTGFLTARTELLATAAGPGVNLLCACLLGRAAPQLAGASLLLGGFNLLPVYPLDGGRLLLGLLRLRWGLSGVRAALYLSTAFSAVLVALALYAALHWKTGFWSVVSALLLFIRLLQMQSAEKAVAFPAADL